MKKVVLFCFFLFSYLWCATPTSALSKTIITSGDTSVEQAYPNQNYGRTAGLTIYNHADGMAYSLFKFDLSGIPQNATIQSAQFQILFVQCPAGTNNVSIGRISENWDEYVATWNHKPNWVATSINKNVTGWGYYNPRAPFDSIDITEIVKKWQYRTYPNYGIYLLFTHAESNFGGYGCSLYSREDIPEKRPQLTITYTIPPVIQEVTLQVSQIAASEITATSAKITWKSTFNATSHVSYYTTSAQNAISAGQDDNTQVHIVVLHNLFPGTTYNYTVTSRDVSGHSATSSVFTFRTNALVVVSPGASGSNPVISNVIEDTTPQTARIAWNTQPSTLSQLNYSSTQNTVNSLFQNGTPIIDNNLTSNHAAYLSRLTPGTRYYYVISVTDSNERTKTSEVRSFTTPLQGDGGQPTAIPGSHFTPPPLPDRGGGYPSPGQSAGSGKTSPSSSGTSSGNTASPSGTNKNPSRLNLPSLFASAGIRNFLPLFLISLGIIFFIIVFILLIIFFTKKPAKKTIAKPVNHQKTSPPQTASFLQTKPLQETRPAIAQKKSSLTLPLLIGCGCGCLVLILIITVLGLMPFLLRPMGLLPWNYQKNDPIIVEPPPNITPVPSLPNPSSAPAPTLESLDVPLYHEVSDGVKNLALNCDSKDFIPERFRSNKYYCKNIYQVNTATFRSDVAGSGADRLLLYGENLFFDCPLKIANVSDIAGRCFKSAKFTDNRQFPIMMNIFGVQNLRSKGYFYFEPSFDKIHTLCNHPTASACYIDSNILISPLIRGGEALYSQKSYQANFYEGFDKQVEYSFTVQNPSNCYATDTHELIHYMTYQFSGTYLARQWFSEGQAHSLEAKVFKEVCPPGSVFSNVVKKENGKEESLNSFDITAADLEEPLSAAVESYCNNNSCCKAIYKEQARVYKEKGLSYIPAFYNEISKMLRSYETDFARALYIAEGSPEWLKTYFRQNGCTD